jgi:DNA-binding transcriptional ArsR family regulator
MRAHDNKLAGGSDSQQPVDAEQLAAGADLLRHMADPTRLHLLRLLADEEADVSSLSARVSASRSSVSQHLGRLRLAGLVQARRDGRRMVYRVVSTHVSALVAETLKLVDHAVHEIAHHHRSPPAPPPVPHRHIPEPRAT